MKLLLNKTYIPIMEASSFQERLQGLIGKRNINYGMFFSNCNAIHTFLMQEAIDVIGLNEQMEIIFIKQNVTPNKIIKIHHPIKKTSILELPFNTSYSLKLGDKLFFEFEDIV